MKIKEIIVDVIGYNQLHKQTCLLECEHCGHVEKRPGEMVDYLFEQNLPGMGCSFCGKNRAGEVISKPTCLVKNKPREQKREKPRKIHAYKTRKVYLSSHMR
jgi:hypothetical protein